MVEPLEQAREWDVEALVRAAGGYVRPSEELRPRVLESARVEASERRAQSRIWNTALAIAVLAAVSAAAGARWHVTSPFAPSVLQAQAEVQQASGNSAGWTLVESFTDLRRRQAALLSLTR